jgi:hypothetical protein
MNWDFIQLTNETITMTNDNDNDYYGCIEEYEDPADYVRIKSTKAVRLG